MSGGMVGVQGIQQKDKIEVIVNKGNVTLENVKAGTTVEIYSADGQCLKSIVYSAPIQTGDLSGVCILKIYNGDTVICKKIVL